jgi:hypothetical protein
MVCSLCQCHGHNRRTCPTVARSPHEETFVFPGNPWVYVGHEADDALILERLRAHRRAQRDLQRPHPIDIRNFFRDNPQRLEAERLEAERLEAERLEAERLEHERLEHERLDKDQGFRYLRIVNMRSEDYQIYWVNGNNLILSLDDHLNEVVLDSRVLAGKQSVLLNVRDGDRYYLIPCAMDAGRQRDDSNIKGAVAQQVKHTHPTSQILTLDVHEGHQERLFVDKGWTLSVANQWKFQALQLNYLLEQVIKLGGMNHDNIAPILDLHQDIPMHPHTELDKEYAGIPSEFTNLT